MRTAAPGPIARAGGRERHSKMDIGHWLESGAIALRLGADSKRQALAALSEVAGRVLR